MSVEIKTKKKIDPKIYAYTTPTVTSNEGWIKIGYTERDVTQRIKEQTHTAHIATDILWTAAAAYTEEPDKGKTFKDHDFHHFLSFHDVERRPKTEWFYFNGTPEKSKSLFDKFVQHDLSGYQPGKGQDYTLRQEQEEAVAKTLAYFKNHPGGKFLWNAKPRFGKTLSTYDLARRMEAINVLIVTNRPAIANSWYDDFETFIAGQTTYKFVSESDSLKNRPTLSRKEFVGLLDDDVRQLAFISLQDLKGSAYLGGEHNKLKWVTDLHWDLLVIDEAHEGVDTFKTDQAFNKIRRNFTLHLSGTPFKALAKGDFTEEQIYNWSYADEQSAKSTWSPEQEEENPYESLPQLNLFTYQMSQMIGEELEKGAQLDGENIDGKGEAVTTKVFNTQGKYSWIKAPRYNGMPMQVGPLANIVVNFAKGNKFVVPVVEKFLKDTGLPLEAVLSTLGRTATRMIEAKVIADNGLLAFNNLIANIKSGDTQTCAKYVIDKDKEYRGRYIGHVPRGVLSHWCRIKNGVIENWQAVVPSTWNASPKDSKGQMATYEACLVGMKIADLKQPLEIIRKIHSYDPCIACAVHVMDTKGNDISEYKINPNIVC